MQTRKVPWTLITGVLTLFFVLALLSPAAVADTNDSKKQRLMYVLQYVFDFVQNNYVEEVDPEILAEGAFKGIFESLGDPYSAYLSDADFRGLGDITAGEFGGVGLYINKQLVRKGPDGRDLPSYVEVVAPIEDTPAYRAGIQAGDLIVKVEEEATDSITLNDVVEKLRGPVGSTVTITIQRGVLPSGGGARFDVSLGRAKIQVPTVKWAIIPAAADRPLSGNIGYLRIIQFTRYTPEKVSEALEALAAQKYSRLIIDLRSNPGGLLDAVVQTADLFFDDGVIVSTRSRLASENRVFEATPGVMVPSSVPVVVLIDNGSASASEIFAGVIKDRGRGILFGTKTYGKGSVQQVHGMPLAKGGFRLTMSRYYTPSGVTIDKVGIEPDRQVKEPDLSEAETAALSKLIEGRKSPQFVKHNPEPPEKQTSAFVSQLVTEFPALGERILRRMVRNEVNRHMVTPPVYDLDYDTVLREAVKYFSQGEVSGALQ
ncbi:MAG: S41 family peptidase [Spirochaetales bacterium]|jgi:carboxyl-terminal processing protease|nr:S41 family peptidase [Spirochaetales bacterium]